MTDENATGLTQRIRRIGQSDVAAGYSLVTTPVLLAALIGLVGWFAADLVVNVRADAVMAKAAAVALADRVDVLETVSNNHISADVEVRRAVNDRVGRIEAKLDTAAGVAAATSQQIAVLSARFDGLLAQLRRQADNSIPSPR